MKKVAASTGCIGCEATAAKVASPRLSGTHMVLTQLAVMLNGATLEEQQRHLCERHHVYVETARAALRGENVDGSGDVDDEGLYSMTPKDVTLQ